MGRVRLPNITLSHLDKLQPIAERVAGFKADIALDVD
jgi:hypothetical protein